MRRTANVLLLTAILAIGVSGCGVNEPENISHWDIVADAFKTHGMDAAAIKADIEAKTHMMVESCEIVDGKPVVILAPPMEEMLDESAFPTDYTPFGLGASLLANIGLALRVLSDRKKYRPKPEVTTGNSFVDTTLVHDKRAAMEEGASSITGGSYAEVEPQPAMESVSVIDPVVGVGDGVGDEVDEMIAKHLPNSGSEIEVKKK